MTLSSYSNLILKASATPLITCMTCGDMMVISLLEPVTDGFELRSYSCEECGIVEQFVTEL